MSISPYTPLTLTPEQKGSLLIANAIQKNLEERAKTDKLYHETVKGLREVNQEQTVRNDLLEKEIQLLKAAYGDLQLVNQSLQNRVDALVHENGELSCKNSEQANTIDYLKRGIAVLNLENAENFDRRSQYYDILGAFLGWSGHSLDAALHKCRTFGFSILRRV